VEEFEANVSVDTDRYVSQIHLEAESLRNIIDRFIVPAGIEMIHKMKILDCSLGVAKRRLDRINTNITEMMSGTEKLTERSKGLSGTLEGCKYILKEIIPQMVSLRGYADDLESITDSKLWPLPSYEDMLYERHDQSGQL